MDILCHALESYTARHYAEVGYALADIPDLVAGAVKQQRLLTMAPRDVMAEDLEAIFSDSMRNW